MCGDKFLRKFIAPYGVVVVVVKIENTFSIYGIITMHW